MYTLYKQNSKNKKEYTYTLHKQLSNILFRNNFPNTLHIEKYFCVQHFSSLRTLSGN